MSRPPFVPTKKDRDMVKAMVGYGVPEDDICKVIVNPQTGKPLSKPTLIKHFRRELDLGQLEANAKVAQSLFRKATGNGPQCVSAAIFWLKTRARWKETDRLEVTGANGGAILQGTVTPEQLAEAVRSVREEF